MEIVDSDTEPPLGSPCGHRCKEREDRQSRSHGVVAACAEQDATGGGAERRRDRREPEHCRLASINVPGSYWTMTLPVMPCSSSGPLE